MNVAVWDTYVTKKNGLVMHFDIVAPVETNDAAVIHEFGREFLKLKDQEGQTLTSKECKYCHIEQASQLMIDSIEQKGYHIIEMQNCD